MSEIKQKRTTFKIIANIFEGRLKAVLFRDLIASETNFRSGLIAREQVIFLFILLFSLLILTACYSPFGIYHTVKRGETLYDIARTYNVSVNTLQDSNFLRDPDVLHPGDQIFVPGAGYPKDVKKSNPDSKVAKKKTYNKKLQRKKSKDRKTAMLNVPKDKIKFIWPVEGVFTSGFGIRNGNFHTGIDLAAPIGTLVRCAAEGHVIYADNKQRNYGNLVIVEHKHDFITLYAHLDVMLVHEGDHVKQGEVIAKVGNTGRSTGPHLHFEIRYNREAIDPMALLP